MYPAAFEYHSPTTLKDALGLMGKHGDDAKVLAGGHSLIPMMKLRLAQPKHLIDLRNVPGLKGMKEDGNTIAIGAMTTWYELESQRDRQGEVPDRVARRPPIVGDPAVRNLGTIGGVARARRPGRRHAGHGHRLRLRVRVRRAEGPPHGEGGRLVPGPDVDRGEGRRDPRRDPRARARQGHRRRVSQVPAPGVALRDRRRGRGRHDGRQRARAARRASASPARARRPCARRASRPGWPARTSRAPARSRPPRRRPPKASTCRRTCRAPSSTRRISAACSRSARSRRRRSAPALGGGLRPPSDAQKERAIGSLFLRCLPPDSDCAGKPALERPSQSLRRDCRDRARGRACRGGWGRRSCSCRSTGKPLVRWSVEGAARRTWTAWSS